MRIISKYNLKTLAALFAILLSATSCLNEYLDRAPDSDLDEEEVFTKYQNFSKYFRAVYAGTETKMRPYYPLCFNLNSGKITTDALTDICDPARDNNAHKIKQGDGQSAITQFGYNVTEDKESGKLVRAWKIMRICNRTIQNIDMLQDATKTEKEDMLAQAYFIRAYVNFDIFRFYGSVPYVDRVLGADEEWDLPAPGEYEFLQKVADDFQAAAEHFKTAGKMRRDPSGNLSASDQNRPSGVAALALRGRALMYAASPLNNPNGDKDRWVEAAQANWEALQAALDNNYKLLTFSEISKNFHDTKHTNEQLWSYSYTTLAYTHSTLQSIVPGIFCKGKYAGQNVGRCPTQNFVDKFETIDGYALNTEEQREIATKAGSYYEQNPYIHRDPRLDLSVVYNQKIISGFSEPAPLYVDEAGNKSEWMTQPTAARDNSSRTYYYECKTLGGPYSNNTQAILLVDPIIRLAEVYLNYAECAFEAYGSSKDAVPGANLTSVDALNVVRERAGMPAVRDEYLSDPETYRSRIKNERAIELCFEGDHYYCDIRRWKDAPAIGRSTLYGMRATKLNPGYDTDKYPTGFRYERFALGNDRQIAWKNDGMYYIRFRQSDLNKMKNYTPKQEW